MTSSRSKASTERSWCAAATAWRSRRESGWYLKYVCHCQLSFNGDQLNLPEQLPLVNETIRQVSPFQYRYCFNFCAFSYTLAWWDWPQWERMIDWMALHGINMPLSVTGQEAIWQKVYRTDGADGRADLASSSSGRAICRSVGWGASTVGAARCRRVGSTATWNFRRRSSPGSENWA